MDGGYGYIIWDWIFAKQKVEELEEKEEEGVFWNGHNGRIWALSNTNRKYTTAKNKFIENPKVQKTNHFILASTGNKILRILKSNGTVS